MVEQGVSPLPQMRHLNNSPWYVLDDAGIFSMGSEPTGANYWVGIMPAGLLLLTQTGDRCIVAAPFSFAPLDPFRA